MDGVTPLPARKLSGHDRAFLSSFAHARCDRIVTDAPSTTVAILTIDHPSRGTFDDRLRRAGYGYDRLRIDDILRRVGYRPSRFEYLPDLLAACDTRAFDLFIVQCETACRRTTDAIHALRTRFAGTVAIVSISQRDADLAQSACFVAGANEHLPYAASPDALIGVLGEGSLLAQLRPAVERSVSFAQKSEGVTAHCVDCTAESLGS